MTTFFASDTHFLHRLVADQRGFASPEEHDEAVIERWNDTVRPGDMVWHLGDVGLGNEAGVLAAAGHQLDTAEIANEACEAHNAEIARRNAALRLRAGPVLMLTGDEREAIRLAGELYTHIADRVAGKGPTRDDDLAEIRRSIHDIQYRVEAQAAARLYPGEFRLMGEVIGQPANDREGGAAP